MQNTKINYTYRDAGNYHIDNERVIPGTITLEQKQIILSCCDPKEDIACSTCDSNTGYRYIRSNG